MWTEDQGGKIKYREKYRDPMTGKEKTVSVIFDRKSDKKAREILEQKIREKTRGSSRLTLREAVDLYRKDQKKTVQRQTYDRNFHCFEVLLPVLGGDNFLDRLTAGYIRERLLTQDKTAGAMNEQIRRIKAFVRWCYRADLIESTACIDKLKPFDDVPHRVKIKDKFLEASELQALLDGMDDEGYRLVTEFLALSGLRISELIALDKKHVHDDYIEIAQGYEINFHIVKESTKTGSSFRLVHLQPQLRDCLDRLIAFMDRRKKMLGVRVPYVCVDRKGKRLEYYAYKKYLKKVSSQVLDREITPHALRHTHASLLAENGVPIDTTQRRLGHASSRVTKEIYTHVTQTQKKKDDALLDKIEI